jgi:hypothetical protein
VFKKGNPGYIEVCNEKLLFVALGKDDNWHFVTSLSLSAIFDKDNAVNFFPAKLRNYDFSLLIIPDFWFGNAKYPFHSHNKSVIRSFLARKLFSEFPGTPRIQDFFSYNISRNENGEHEISARFPQEPRFFDLYQVLADNDLRPLRISTPALLWNKRLKDRVNDFAGLRLGLINVSDNGCSLFFFYQGHLLFSRSIYLPEAQEDRSSQLEVIAYEMNQSIYHYSQRTKKNLERICFFSEEKMGVGHLTEALGREVEELSFKIRRRDVHYDPEIDVYGDGVNFEPEEILDPMELPGVSDRSALNDVATTRMFISGILIGAVVFIMIGMEFLYLTHIKRNGTRTLKSMGSGWTQSIQQYNDALDAVLNEEVQKDPMDLVEDLAGSLPENILVQSMDVSVDKSSVISLSGVIRTKGAEDLSRTLNEFLEKLNKNIQGAKMLTPDDVDIEMNGQRTDDGSIEHHISFKWEVS